jgi:hemoglobin
MMTTPRTPYEVLGEEGIRRVVDRFYDLMESEPKAVPVRAMHAKKLDPMREKLTVFFVGWMGGPQTYGERYGSVNVPTAHTPFDIGPVETELWVELMAQAVDEAKLPEPFGEQVMVRMRHMADMCRTLEADGTLRPQYALLRADWNNVKRAQRRKA